MEGPTVKIIIQYFKQLLNILEKLWWHNSSFKHHIILICHSKASFMLLYFTLYSFCYFFFLFCIFCIYHTLNIVHSSELFTVLFFHFANIFYSSFLFTWLNAAHFFMFAFYKSLVLLFEKCKFIFLFFIVSHGFLFGSFIFHRHHIKFAKSRNLHNHKITCLWYVNFWWIIAFV